MWKPSEHAGGAIKGRGGSTRPYRFGEFDLLAVAMYPSTHEWNTFMYTVADWLLPGRTDPSEILKFQPVATLPNDDWTSDFHTGCGVVTVKLAEKGPGTIDKASDAPASKGVGTS